MVKILYLTVLVAVGELSLLDLFVIDTHLIEISQAEKESSQSKVK